MISQKSSGTFTSAGVLSAFAASICCITPVISLLAGSSSIAASISWVEPARPYLIALSISFLALAWYLKLNPVKMDNTDCDCKTTKEPSFFQSKTFLSVITVFAMLMLTFPLYAKMFYPQQKIQAASPTAGDNKEQARFYIQGMSCADCESEVNNKLSKVNGVTAYKTSYENKNGMVTFDKSKVDIKTIETAINKTGYKVKSIEICEKNKSCLKRSGNSCCDKQ